jgi:hypothetical protein
MRRLNEWLADRLAFGLSTMACFYVVTALVVAPLFWQHPHTAVEWMQYVISVLFQGSALPLLGYVARVQGEKQEKILRETHDAVMEELTEIRKISNAQRRDSDG